MDGFEPLLATAELKALQQLAGRARVRRPRPGALIDHGAARRARRGRGLELFDLRPYQAGDEIRHIDWRVSARSGRTITRLFEEERQHHLFLVVDRGPSMRFGTRREPKVTTAARAAVLLGFAALAAGGTVGGVVAGETVRRFPAARGLDGVFPLIDACRAYCAPVTRPPGRDWPDPEIDRLSGEIAAGSSVVVISDFLHYHPGVPLARYLPLSPRFRTTAVVVMDPSESVLPAAGMLPLATPSGIITVDLDDAGLRRRYHAVMSERRQALARLCRHHGVEMLNLYNDRDTWPQLQGLL